MKKLLQQLKLEELWTNKRKKDEISYESIINTRLGEYFSEQWLNSGKDTHKGSHYLELTLFNCEMKPYLNFIIKDTSVLDTLKLRTGSHKPSIEIDKYRNRKAYDECPCNYVIMKKIEDIYHVIAECLRYKEIREKDLRFLLNTGNKKQRKTYYVSVC